MLGCLRALLVAEFEMKSAGIYLAIVLALSAIAGKANAQDKPATIDSADALFQKGEFGEAGEQYALIAADHADDYAATLQLARIALLSNRLDDAQTWLKKAIVL